jgi:hypothetical protein
MFVVAEMNDNEETGRPEDGKLMAFAKKDIDAVFARLEAVDAAQNLEFFNSASPLGMILLKARDRCILDEATSYEP